MYSAIKGDVLAVGRLLYESVRDVNKRSVHEDTAMHFVCQSGALQIARRLIEHKANVNIENEDGETLLDIALHMGNEDMVNRLSGASSFLMVGEEINPLQVDELAAFYDSGFYSDYYRLEYACTSNGELAFR
jgi:ankyrin repeat protein